jgi:hypothetical protein
LSPTSPVLFAHLLTSWCGSTERSAGNSNRQQVSMCERVRGCVCCVYS